MTKLRNRPQLDYHMLIVRPSQNFVPKDWRDQPDDYQVISYEGADRLRGRADAWAFMFNREQPKDTKIKEWAIVRN